MTTKFIYHRILHCFSALLLSAGLVLPFDASAQLSHHVENMAFGGGGTAYSTGSEALFINPANLFIRENKNLSISLFQGSIFLYGLQSVDGLQNNISTLKSTLSPYDHGNELTILSEEQRDKIINRNYHDDLTTRSFTAQSDVHWFGIKWYGDEKAYALSLRSRIGNRFTLGRGLFSDEIVENRGELIIDRSFQQTYQVQHELSFGYSESFTFLNGIQPKRPEFIIGIAPKLVIPGSGLNVHATNQYLYQPESSVWIHNTEYYQLSTGALTEKQTGALRTFSEEPSRPFQPNPVSLTDLFRPTGIGLGLDIGITYLIPFGDHEPAKFSSERRDTKQSIRFSVSIIDVGATILNRNPSEIFVGLQSTESNNSGNVTEFLYSGAPNEHYYFLNRLGVNIPEQAGLHNQDDENPLYTMLPASIQTGAFFQYNWFKLIGDASYSMVESAYRQSGLVSYLGTEIKPFHFLPLRAGTRFGKNLPPLFSFGTGFETDDFDISAAFMIQAGDLSDPSSVRLRTF